MFKIIQVILTRHNDFVLLFIAHTQKFSNVPILFNFTIHIVINRNLDMYFLFIVSWVNSEYYNLNWLYVYSHNNLINCFNYFTFKILLLFLIIICWKISVKLHLRKFLINYLFTPYKELKFDRFFSYSILCDHALWV